MSAWWSGDEWRWRLKGPTHQPSISVIERPTESYDAHHKRKMREDGAERVPFGFSRALHNDPTPDTGAES